MKPCQVPLVAALLASSAGNSLATVRYVDADCANPVPPYLSWATAATSIQAAIDIAAPGDQILVTNGLYATGGRAVHGTMTNRVAVDKPLHLQSVNGPAVTIIQGYQVPGATNGDGAIRCVYLANRASLSGFTLANGATRATNDNQMYHESSGGGVHCEALQSYLDPPIVVSNCVLTGNSAFGPGGGVYGGGVLSARIIDCELRGNTAQVGGGVAEGWVERCVIADNAAGNGGGASEASGEAGGWEYYSCKLDNCLLVGNRAQYDGGGAYCCELNNCTVAGNSAGQAGGGIYGFVVIVVQHPARAVNCIVYSNTAPGDENFISYACNFESSCTTPLPTWGVRNITNSPLFVDLAGHDLRLQPNSPCINAGDNAYAPSSTDLDGDPRTVGGSVDMGAYEFQSPASVLSYAWLQQYGLPTDGSADFSDTDDDGHNNWQEWRCRTIPTNALSVLRLRPPVWSASNVTLSWPGVEGLRYFVERSTNMSASPPFNVVATNVVGASGTTSFTDGSAPVPGHSFYRVGVAE